ncbi:MAG: hypothetical protein ACPIOQ_66450, partial [Promethearchaeia archaeon]
MMLGIGTFALRKPIHKKIAGELEEDVVVPSYQSILQQENNRVMKAVRPDTPSILRQSVIAQLASARGTQVALEGDLEQTGEGGVSLADFEGDDKSGMEKLLQQLRDNKTKVARLIKKLPASQPLTLEERKEVGQLLATMLLSSNKYLQNTDIPLRAASIEKEIYDIYFSEVCKKTTGVKNESNLCFYQALVDAGVEAPENEIIRDGGLVGPAQRIKNKLCEELQKKGQEDSVETTRSCNKDEMAEDEIVKASSNEFGLIFAIFQYSEIDQKYALRIMKPDESKLSLARANANIEGAAGALRRGTSLANVQKQHKVLFLKLEGLHYTVLSDKTGDRGALRRRRALRRSVSRSRRRRRS